MTGDPQQNPPDGASQGWAVLGTLIAGMAVWGGAGALLDRWLGTRAFLPIGVIAGTAAAVYLIVVKYGKP
ncbi:MAG: AtpZ/AtpI family protein [Actinobacteria bacterium]|nr:AtpZ/AtpI family protein [Actinomycetota bacterium]